MSVLRTGPVVVSGPSGEKSEREKETGKGGGG